MKGAIASVELFAFLQPPEAGGAASGKRLTLTLTAPERLEGGTEWQCRVALADLHRPETIVAADSVSALAFALRRSEEWLNALRSEGQRLCRDRDGEVPFEADALHGMTPKARDPG